MERNQLKICSDPYRKHIDYFWLEENGTWTNMQEMENSPLKGIHFTSLPLSHNAYDMFKAVIDQLYDPAVGVTIVFEGTEDDLEELISIQKLYFSEYNIDVQRGVRKIRPAKEVMAQMELAYEKLHNFFKEYPDKDTEAILAKYTDTVKPEIAICVMGLYSSGKSAFLNSIIGQEILPSDSDPATAKIFKVKSSKTHSVSFQFDGVDYKIEFSGSKWMVNQDPTSEIIQKIAKAVAEHAPKAENQVMYWVLYALNDFAKKEGRVRQDALLSCAEKLLSEEELKETNNDAEKIDTLLEKYRVKELVAKGEIPANKMGDFIEIEVDFVHSYLPLDKFDFVFYDTPGSNAVMFREYADILKESLEQQTNVLPLLVTNPDSMDEIDNNEIMAVVNEMGGALDVSNLMLVVNKSDEKSRRTLQKKAENKDNLVLVKWKASRVYFVSSIIALGGKQNGAEMDWIDEDYYSIFEEKQVKFSKPDNKLYLRLFEYNILPRDSYEKINKRVENIDPSELLLWNSGLPCVEEEIGDFAKKYSIYNKCSQAIQYLVQAANMIKKDVRDSVSKADSLRSIIEKSLDDKKQELVKKVQIESESKRKEYSNRFLDAATKVTVNKYLDDSRIERIIDDILADCPGKTDSERLSPFNDKVEASLKRDIQNYSKDATQNTEEYWQKCANQFRSYLMETVAGSSALTPEQKADFENISLNVVTVSSIHKTLNITSTSAVVNKGKRLLGGDLTRISRSESKLKYKEALKTDIANNNKKVFEENERSFQIWANQLINKLISELSTYSPELTMLGSNLDSQKEVIDAKLAQGELIGKEIDAIEELLDFQ